MWLLLFCFANYWHIGLELMITWCWDCCFWCTSWRASYPRWHHHLLDEEVEPWLLVIHGRTLAEEETNHYRWKASKQSPCPRYFGWFFSTHGFHVLVNGFSTSHGLVFFWSLSWISTSGLACIHVPYIGVLCPWDWVSTFCGLVFFLSLWIWFELLVLHALMFHTLGFCVLGNGFQFFGDWCFCCPYGFEHMVLYALFSVILMMPMHKAIEWYRNSINPFCVACAMFVGRSCKFCVLLLWYTKRC
jgi:hypothetical protein